MNTWRYRCPNGHSNWKPKGETNYTPRKHPGKYYCQSCDTHFNKLVDTMNKEMK